MGYPKIIPKCTYLNICILFLRLFLAFLAFLLSCFSQINFCLNFRHHNFDINFCINITEFENKNFVSLFAKAQSVTLEFLFLEVLLKIQRIQRKTKFHFIGKIRCFDTNFVCYGFQASRRRAGTSSQDFSQRIARACAVQQQDVYGLNHKKVRLGYTYFSV